MAPDTGIQMRPAMVSRVETFSPPLRYFPEGMDRPLLAQSVAATVPAWGLVALGMPDAAALVFFGLLFVLLVWHGLHKSPERITAVLVATMPAMAEFRSLRFFNGPQLILLVAFLIWYEFRRAQAQEVMKDRVFAGLMLFSLVNWLGAWHLTGDYSQNFRHMDLVMAAVNVVLLYRYVPLFRTAMLGLGLCVLGEGFAFMGHGGRLGAADFGEDVSLGNPIVFGVPAALLVLLSMVHGGKLLQLKESPVSRYALMGMAGVGLLLSTSRGSWLIAIAGLCVVFVFDKARRPALIGCALALVAAAAVLIQTERGATLEQYLHKTFDSDVSIEKKTTGRIDQWRSFPRMLAESPVWGQLPGRSRPLVAEYTGRELALHSLYLHVGVEWGLIGLCLLAWMLIHLGMRGWTQATRFGDPVPLMALVGFITMGFSVIGFDLAGGTYLGLAMLKPRGRLYVAREVMLAPDEGSGYDPA
ncbi:MAG: O-antigen ligase family protein [Bryobacteraceae bacterium]